MTRPSIFADIKTFLIQTAAAVCAAAITAYLTVPDQQLHFDSIILGLVSIPIALLFGEMALGLCGLFIIVEIADVILNWLDGIDLFS